MANLSNDIWHSYFDSKDHYVALRAKWSQLVNSEDKHQLSVEYHLLYAILRGRDWRKCFSFPVEHKGDYKSRNPFYPGGTIHNAFRNLSFPYCRRRIIQLCDNLINDKMIDKALSYVKRPEFVHPPIWDLPYNQEHMEIEKWIELPLTDLNPVRKCGIRHVKIDPWKTEELMEA